MNKKKLLLLAREIYRTRYPFKLKHFIGLLSKATRLAEPEHEDVAWACQKVFDEKVNGIKNLLVKYFIVQDLKKRYPTCISDIERYENVTRL